MIDVIEMATATHSRKAEEEQPRLATEIASLWPPQGQWTEQDYLNLPDSNHLIELSDGVISIMPPPSYEHQRIVANFYRLLYSFVVGQNLGEVAFAPLAVRLWPGKIREPDVLFYSHAHADRLGGTISGVPDLVAEVVSPGSRRLDRQEKFVEYARAGVAEYWLIDPEQKTVTLFVLGEEGAFGLVGQAGMGEVVVSQLLVGFEVATTAVFA